MIRLQDVGKVYRTTDGPVYALQEVTLDVTAGEFVTVRGPSGSGKSTLLTMIGGLNTPTSGKVIVAGEDLQAISGRERAKFRSRNIGFVFQMFHLVPYLTVLENVLVPLPHGNRFDGRQRALELLKKVQMSDRLQHRPEQLSTGERQRVAIARAWINEPQILLADEPTGNLDPGNASAVLDLLAEFHGVGGTVLLVTHDELAARHAGRTVFLRNGRIASQRDLAETVTSGAEDTGVKEQQPSSVE